MYGFILFLSGLIFGAVAGVIIVEQRDRDASERVSDVDIAKDLSEECYPDAERNDYPSEEEYEIAEGRVYDHRNAYVNGFVAAIHTYNKELGLQ